MPPQIYIEADGTGARRLIDDTSVSATNPTWSPDGTKIAFVRDICSSSGRCSGAEDIYVINADGTDQKNLSNTATAREFRPAWSSDSTKLVYARPESEKEHHSRKPD